MLQSLNFKGVGPAPEMSLPVDPHQLGYVLQLLPC